MKALVLEEYKKLTLSDVPKPEPGERDLLVRIQACGICGSDVHGFDGSTGRRIPPIVMGHEAAGLVEAVGDKVEGFAVGDRVTFDSTVSCGHCSYCQAGRINLCENRMVLGVSCDEFKRDGCFAEYATIPQNIAYHLPADFPYEHAALIEAVSIAVHAAGRPGIQLGDSAVVVGSGMIGLLVIQAVKAAGASQIIAVDLADEKLAMAAELGATATLNAGTEDVAARVAELTGGEGAHHSFEVVGANPTVLSAIDCVRKGGHITLVGNLAPEVTLPLQKVVTRELTLHGSCASNGEYPTCIDLMAAGVINVAPLISATSPLEDAASWFDRLYAGEAGLMKVVVTP